MCGRYFITTPPQAMRDLFDFAEQPNFPPRYNIAPSQPVPIIRLEGGKRHFALVRWGLIPSWAKEMPQTLLINARAETIAEKPSFRGAFRHRRCLMPADGFYEWRAAGRGPKQPFLIRRRDGRPLAFAAIWDNWMSKDGGEIETAAIVTTEANATLRDIHVRMPVILDEKDRDIWLDPAANEKELLALLRPAPDDLLEAVPVSDAVNRVSNDNASLLVPLDKRTAAAMTLPEPKPKKKSPPTDDRQPNLL